MSEDATQNQEQIQIWTGYTRYLLEVDGLLQATEALCKKLLGSGTFYTISGVIGAAHVALQGVDKQLVDGIYSMKQGNAPQYNFDPSPLPDWPPNPSSPSVFAGAWESIKGVLEQMMSVTTSPSVMGVTIAGLIDRGDDVARLLETSFG